MEKLWASFKFEPSIYQSCFHRFVIEKIVNRFLDDEEFAIFEVEFWDYSLPAIGKKSRVISKRFSCEQEEYDLIHSWVLK